MESHERKMSRVEVHGDAGQLDEKPEEVKPEVSKVVLESGQYEGQNGVQQPSPEVSSEDSDEIPANECYRGGKNACCKLVIQHQFLTRNRLSKMVFSFRAFPRRLHGTAPESSTRGKP
jgi:hypothetical protein